MCAKIGRLYIDFGAKCKRCGVNEPTKLRAVRVGYAYRLDGFLKTKISASTASAIVPDSRMTLGVST